MPNIQDNSESRGVQRERNVEQIKLENNENQGI